MSLSDHALQLFREGYNCSQAVLTTFCRNLQLDTAIAQSLSAGFGAGMGRSQMTCGAVSGAVMVLGMYFFNANERDSSKDYTYKKVLEFIDRFTKRHGTTECIRLLGVDITTHEGYTYAQEKNLFDTRCERIVSNTIEILLSLIPSDTDRNK